jgi:cyclase
MGKLIGAIISLLVSFSVFADHHGSNVNVRPNSQLDFPRSPPPGFVPPPLHPKGVVLETRKLGDGIYALMANTPFNDNAGFIVGKDAVLVIDSHFNGSMGLQIINAVKRVTDLPIKYLLNTNAFGDHVFGNYVFPEDTQIIAHQSTVDSLELSSVEGISQTMARTVGGDLSVFRDVKLRVPDVGFKRKWETDLGDKVVEMYWFGSGMSPHDSVVYLPDAKIAWTANLVFGDGSIPWARSGEIEEYRRTLVKLSNMIQPITIVSGHGEIVSGEMVMRYIEYLSQTIKIAERAVVDKIPMNDLVAGALVPSAYPIRPALEKLMTGFHRWNLRVAYEEALID